jgi:pyruvate formate lyase activating enzyme
VCPHGALAWKGEEMTAGRIAEEAQRLLPFFRRSGGGVTFTGGEPLLQPDFTFAASQLCRRRGIHVALETTGYAAWDVIERQAAVTDLWLYDLKHADPERHKADTGVSNRRLLANLGRLVDLGAEIVIRVPLIPGHNDTAADIAALADQAVRRGATRISLLPFNPAAHGKYSWLRRTYPLPDARKQSADEIAALEDVARERGMLVVAA